jgi:hypothetical protein
MYKCDYVNIYINKWLWLNFQVFLLRKGTFNYMNVYYIQSIHVEKTKRGINRIKKLEVIAIDTYQLSIQLIFFFYAYSTDPQNAD